MTSLPTVEAIPVPGGLDSRLPEARLGFVPSLQPAWVVGEAAATARPGQHKWPRVQHQPLHSAQHRMFAHHRHRCAVPVLQVLNVLRRLAVLLCSGVAFGTLSAANFVWAHDVLSGTNPLLLGATGRVQPAPKAADAPLYTREELSGTVAVGRLYHPM